ncbi:MAG: hypothetical protein ACP5DX_17205 [Paracoccaceae bacterium]
MADAQMEEFQDRLRRVTRNRHRGKAFATVDTFGGVPHRARTRRMSLLRPALLLVAVFMALKAALLLEIGPADYQDRVDRLRAGSQMEAAGAWAMQMDPMTVWLAQQMRELLRSPV